MTASYGIDFESRAKNYFLFGFNVAKAGDAKMVIRLGVRPEPQRSSEH